MIKVKCSLNRNTSHFRNALFCPANL